MGGFWGVFSSDFGVSFQIAPKEKQRNAKGKTHVFSYEIQVFLYVSCVFCTFSCPLLTRFPFHLSQVFFLACFVSFFLSFFSMEVKRPKKEFLWGSEGLLGPTWSVSGANLPPKTEPKSMFLGGFQEVT